MRAVKSPFGEVIPHLRQEMLCLADRHFFSYPLWNKARASGADLLWRSKKNLILPCQQRLPDGSYLSCIYPSQRARRRGSDAVRVRVIEYRLEGVPGCEPFYRLLTTILDPEQAPAQELAALYPQRWEIETALDELKTHLRGARIVLRSKTPELVEQEFYGLLLAHFAIRGLLHEAALKADEDPDRRFCMPSGLSAASSRALSLSPPRHRKAFHEAVLEVLEERVVSSRGRRNPRAVKRK